MESNEKPSNYQRPRGGESDYRQTVDLQKRPESTASPKGEPVLKADLLGKPMPPGRPTGAANPDPAGKTDAAARQTVSPKSGVSPKTNSAPKETPAPKQNSFVIMGIVLCGVLIAALAILIFFAIKNNQRTVVNIINKESNSAMSLPAANTSEAASESENTSETAAESAASESASDTSSQAAESAAPESETPAPPVTQPPETAPVVTPVPETAPPQTAPAQYALDATGNVDVNGITYRMEPEMNRAAVAKCTSQEKQIVLLDNINGYPVALIYDDAFAGCSSLEYLRVPEGVAWIGTNAFAGCTSLKELVLPDTLGELTAAAFDPGKKITIVSHASAYAREIAEHLGFWWVEGSEFVQVPD